MTATRVLYLTCALLVVVFPPLQASDDRVAILFEDHFQEMRTGPLSSVVGAHTEYHYLREAAPEGQWAVSTFASDQDSQRGWRVQEESGKKFVRQAYTNRAKHWHPMLVAGDPLWDDCQIEVVLARESADGQAGVAFRMRNDRCYYFAGIVGTEAVIKLVQHEVDFHVPNEKVLARADFSMVPNTQIAVRVTLSGKQIRASIAGVDLSVEDSTFAQGRIALTSDVPTSFHRIVVRSTRSEQQTYLARRARADQEERELQAANPKLKLWKKMKTAGFGVGRNLRFGDLNGDGAIEIVVGQVKHHGPTDQYSELSCITALGSEGNVLWQIGTPDRWKHSLTNDVAFQVHDLDGDGKAEVVYCMNQELIVADGLTGKTKYKAPTPESKAPANAFPRILGDCLMFADFRGLNRPSDILIKDRYWHFWVLDDRLNPLWSGECTTGHYPHAADIDRDGKDELAIGYSLYDHDGRQLWSLQGEIKDHADGVAIVDLNQDGKRPQLLWACSDDGFTLVDLNGKIARHHLLGHVQNPAVANFRSDLPGLEVVSINFWTNQGIVHFYDSQGNLYHDFEPNQYGSMCLPVNWKGDGEEYFIHSANVEEGGVFDGKGRRVLVFPADGHPDMCNAVLDMTGDCRDEIVTWDTHEIWIYTQSDNPKPGRLYKPRRNPLHNYSNYQATVSLPGWSTGK